jgi:PIN domain
MRHMGPLLFIDANQYLDLYQMVAGRKLLDAIDEQKSHVFITTQLVNEVLRRKLRIARDFFSNKLKEFADVEAPVPDHLGIGDSELRGLRDAFKTAKEARQELSRMAVDILAKVARSEDHVSMRLTSVFEQAREPTAVALKLARTRREFGNPPGKRSDPLGDQITWEQLLAHSKENNTSRFWLITRDEDFCTAFQKKVFLNPLLLRDLQQTSGKGLEVYCFDNMAEGLAHFGRNAGVPAEKLPLDEELKTIEAEQRALNFISWPPTVSIDEIWRRRQTAAFHEGNLLTPRSE